MDEIVVIGGGVAGLAAVRALRLAGSQPLLISPPSGRRMASLGETLGSSAGRTLDSLQWRDLTEDHAVASPVEGKFSVWGSPMLARHDPRTAPDGFGWHVDRRRLEGAMLSRVDAEPVQRVSAMVRRVERLQDGWRLQLSNGSVTSRFIIDASGRAAIVARKYGERRRLDRLVAVYATYTAPDAEMLHASLVDAAPDGWWYTAPMPGGQLFVAYFTDVDLLPGDLRRDPAVWTARLETAPIATRSRIISLGIDPVGPAQGIADAGTILPGRTSGPGWMAIGDAAAALDPLASHGLAVALWSGERAASVALAALRGNVSLLDAYDATMANGLAQFENGHAIHYGAERRFLDRPFWQRRIGGHQLRTSSVRGQIRPR